MGPAAKTRFATLIGGAADWRGVPDALLTPPARPDSGLVQTGRAEWRIPDDHHVPEPLSVAGTLLMGCASVVEGDLVCAGDVVMADGARVDGRVRAEGVVVLSPGCHVGGGIEARRVEVHGSALVDGGIRAADGVAFLPSPHL